MLCFGVGAAYVDDRLRLTVPSGKDSRWIGVITRDAFAVHNRFIALDEHGRVVDRIPWFLKTATQQGEAVGGDAPFVDGDWARISIDSRMTSVDSTSTASCGTSGARTKQACAAASASACSGRRSPSGNCV